MITPPVAAYIAVGSNVHPDENVPKGLGLLSEQVAVNALSTFYRTPPLARPGQPAFLNGVCRVDSTLPPRDLKFDVLRAIERACGRVRTDDKYAPRTLDLDIALFGDWVVSAPDLQIPDPDLRTRPFLAVPLLELDPDAILPDTGEALTDIAGSLDTHDLHPDHEFTTMLKARLRL